MKNDWFQRTMIAAQALALAWCAAGLQAQDDDSFEALYMKAGEQSMSGEFEEAANTFARILDLSGGYETLYEDFGAQAGGVMYDYGVVLMQLQRWEEAKDYLTKCIDSDKIAEHVETPLKTTNTRANLAKFQLGFVEAQLGNYEEAIRLYDEYLAAAPPEELNQVRNSFKLRYGSALMKMGRVDEGIATIQELFDNREEWKVSSPFLMQGVLELGLAWIEQADAAGPQDEAKLELISTTANTFLDKNGELIRLDPLDQFRYGFVEPLRKLGVESQRVGLYSLAIRYLSYVPTVEQVRKDIYLSLGRLSLGTGIPSQYQQLLDRLDQMDQAEVHPDVQTLRVLAACYSQMGNLRAPRSIYWHLAEQYPNLPEDLRAEVLHEAARYSSLLADFSAAQYFGEKFNEEMPPDHTLKNNVSSFMLQSLFTSQKYDEVIRVSEGVRERFELGNAQREMADSLYPLALYTVQKHEEAAEPFAEYITAYPEGPNREIVMFHRASNSLILGKMREAADQYVDFIKAFPGSERFLDNAYADLAIARFNLQDYPAAIQAAEDLRAARPESIQLGRTLNIRGDSYVLDADRLAKEEEEKKAEWRKTALQSYLDAVEAGQAAEAKDPNRVDFHKEVVSEGLWKAADMYYTDGQIEKGLELYDRFFPAYAGTHWEPQMSVFSLEHLEDAGRGEEALAQVEKVILFLGTQPAETQNITLLRQAIGSYSEASVRIRGLEETLARLDEFPGLDPSNQSLLTWLKIQKVIVLQESRKGKPKESPEYAAVESRIAEVFEEMRKFDIRTLSEFALQQIGLYFAGTENPFLAVPYFEELLARTNPEADAFKAPAEMELGLIEMRAADPAKVQSARERFRRVINQYKDPALTPEAHLNLAKLHMQSKEWKDALTHLDAINKEKKWFGKERHKRAEAGFLMGVVLEELGDATEASQAYVSIVGAYGAYPDWVTQAWERYVPISKADIEKMPESTPDEKIAKRERELSLYRLTKRYLYSWQNWTDEEAPSGALRRLRRDITELKNELGITPQEETMINFQLNIQETGDTEQSGSN